MKNLMNNNKTGRKSYKTWMNSFQKLSHLDVLNVTRSGLATYIFSISWVALTVMVPHVLIAQLLANGSKPIDTEMAQKTTLTYAMMGPSNSIAVIDLNRKIIADSIALTGNPHGGALTPDGRYIYASSMGSNWVSVVDTRARKVVKKIDVGSISHHAIVRADGRYVYVAAENIVVIDTHTNEIVRRITTPQPSFYPVLSPDGNTLYDLSMGNIISVIDTKTNTLVKTIDVGTKAMMGHLIVSPDGETLYATSDMAGLLSIIDAASGRRKATVKIGKRPHGVAVSADGKSVFVAPRGETKLYIVDSKSAKISGARDLKGYPEHLTMTNDGNYLLIGLKKRFTKENLPLNISGNRTAAVTLFNPHSLKIVDEMAVWPQVHQILTTVPLNKIDS